MTEQNWGDEGKFRFWLSLGAQSFESMSSHVQVDMSALSDRGKVQPNNEDHFLVARFERSMQSILTNLPSGCISDDTRELAYGMFVADGMGKNAAGRVASSKIITYLMRMVLHTPDWILRLDELLMREVQRRMEHRFQQLHEALISEAREKPSLAGMGTTLTMTLSLGEICVLVHVGDSRAYVFRENQLHQLTEDDTVARTLAEEGAIRPEDVSTHPMRHVLTNVLGWGGHRVRVQYRELRLKDGDQVLLCTDGLTDLVPDVAIAEVLRTAATARDSCRALVDLALNSGGNDNVTVALGRYHIPELGSLKAV
jgi:protein phosphatase